MADVDVIRGLGRRIFRRTLEEGGGAALPIARLCTSEHVRDLRYIGTIFLIAGLCAFLLAITYLAELVHLFGVPMAWELTISGTVGAACLAAANWAYQTGNRRLGAVDLFACEISVICRVALVVDFAAACVRSATAGTLTGRQFTSQEHYTPVYDSQLAEIEPLDVNVVTSVTEFYTYRKTMMDYLRAFSVATDPVERAGLFDLMLYMQFLMYESGRHAIGGLSQTAGREMGGLVEFEPNRAESLVNVLCSELVLYGYLYRRFRTDYRGDRLRIRLGAFRQEVEALDLRIAESAALPSWRRAATTAPAMMERYRAMLAAVEVADREPD